MRRFSLLLLIPATALAASACGSSDTTTAAISTTSSAAISDTSIAPTAPASKKCALQPSRDLLIWEKWPSLPDSTARIGDVDFGNCVPTLDDWKATEPTGTGHCSKIAWADDNPGYDENAKPAAPLEHVLDEVGPAC